MNNTTRRLFSLLCFVGYISLIGCQLPKELFPETHAHQEHIKQQRTKRRNPPAPPPPAKKLTPEERAIEEQKVKEAFEILHLCT